MKKYIYLISYFLLIVSLGISKAEKFKVLVFSKTAGFRHADQINEQVPFIKKLGAKYGFEVEASEDPGLWSDAYLNQFKAVILLQTSGNFLNSSQQEVFRKYVQSGHGIVGIHAASDAFSKNEWPWYTSMVGTYFTSHPGCNIKDRRGKINIVSHNHPSTSMLPEKWTDCQDEWYYFANNPADKGCIVLATLDESSIETCGVSPMGYHPIIWYHDYDGGRFWYMGRGHYTDLANDKLFEYSLTGGIFYAAGQAAPVLKIN